MLDSIDGSGDFATLAIAECQNNQINIIEKTFFPNSLGIFYHAMTQFLGFKNYGEEYKMMVWLLMDHLFILIK